jgi:Mn-dependent DtxR family transcriptional regulator
MDEKRNLGVIQRKKKYPESYDEYLEIIYRISLKNPKGWVKNKEIAERLGVKPSSVSKMLAKLRDTDLIEWKPRGGIRLSDKGRDRAKMIISNHIIIELFLSNVLHLKDNEEIERIACNLEHYITDEVKLKFMNMMNIESGEIKNVDNLILEDKFPDSIETGEIYNQNDILNFAKHIQTQLLNDNIDDLKSSLKKSIETNDFSFFFD